jgi:rubrerythrin
MSIAFSIGELINIAIGIERRGITFYDIMAKSTDNEIARRVFHALATMEREHIRIFQEMLSESDQYQPAETATEEYVGNLQALVDSAVFTDDVITSEMAAQADSDLKAVELGINAEKDSILFYYQMQDIMPQPAFPIIKKIIAEEKSHLKQLAEIKKGLTASL